MGSSERNSLATMECRLPSTSTYIVGLLSLKLLCFFAYFSTDFEVHRNWIAVTHSLPCSKWYTEKTSKWTIDYPPFFAWYEYALSQLAAVVDENMVKVSAQPYASERTIIFQRFTVVVADLFFILAARMFSKKLQYEKTLLYLLCFNSGLFLVDSVHFQYNSLLYAVLLVSLTLVQRGRPIAGFAVFIVLLHLKHLFLYLLPAYGAFMLPTVCTFYATGIRCMKVFISNGAKMLFCLLSISAVSLGPFIRAGEVRVLLERLFPFKRGLTHTYWAPNFWALYNFIDYSLHRLGRHFHFIFSQFRAGYTSGVVGDVTHAVLPSVTPFSTALCTLCSMIPFCLCVFFNPWKGSFLKLVTACAFCSFLFGWHVHEKAVLTIIIPLTLVAMDDVRYAKVFILMSLIGNYSLFPLLFGPIEKLIKYPIYILFSVVNFHLVNKKYQQDMQGKGSLLSWRESFYLFGLCAVEVFNLIAPILPSARYYPFLPLMVISVYCAAGVSYCFLLFCNYFVYDVISNLPFFWD